MGQRPGEVAGDDGADVADDEVAQRSPSSPTDIFHLQTTDPGMGPPSVGDCHRQHDLVLGGSVDDPEFDGIEMAPDESGVLVVERYVEGGAGTAPFLGRGDDGLAAADRLPEGVAEARVQERGGVLQLTFASDDGALAVAVDGFSLEMGHSHAGRASPPGRPRPRSGR